MPVTRSQSKSTVAPPPPPPSAKPKPRAAPHKKKEQAPAALPPPPSPFRLQTKPTYPTPLNRPLITNCPPTPKTPQFSGPSLMSKLKTNYKEASTPSKLFLNQAQPSRFLNLDYQSSPIPKQAKLQSNSKPVPLQPKTPGKIIGPLSQNSVQVPNPISQAKTKLESLAKESIPSSPAHDIKAPVSRSLFILPRSDSKPHASSSADRAPLTQALGLARNSPVNVINSKIKTAHQKYNFAKTFGPNGLWEKSTLGLLSNVRTDITEQLRGIQVQFQSLLNDLQLESKAGEMDLTFNKENVLNELQLGIKSADINLNFDKEYLNGLKREVKAPVIDLDFGKKHPPKGLQLEIKVADIDVDLQLKNKAANIELPIVKENRIDVKLQNKAAVAETDLAPRRENLPNDIQLQNKTANIDLTSKKENLIDLQLHHKASNIDSTFVKENLDDVPLNKAANIDYTFIKENLNDVPLNKAANIDSTFVKENLNDVQLNKAANIGSTFIKENLIDVQLHSKAANIDSTFVKENPIVAQLHNKAGDIDSTFLKENRTTESQLESKDADLTLDQENLPNEKLKESIVSTYDITIYEDLTEDNEHRANKKNAYWASNSECINFQLYRKAGGSTAKIFRSPCKYKLYPGAVPPKRA